MFDGNTRKFPTTYAYEAHRIPGWDQTKNQWNT